MTKLKPGDKVICHLHSGKIVSGYSAFDDQKEFEIIALDFKGYFFYVPDYYNLSGTTRITAGQLIALKIDKRFLDCSMIYVSQSNVFKISDIMDGMICSSCKEFYKFSEPNQEDGTLKCWRCRAYPLYR